jgi:hypothetical protein
MLSDLPGQPRRFRRHTMHTPKFASSALLIFALTTAAAGQGFKPYPGATKYTPPDTKENREMMKAIPAGTTSIAYITKDPFEKVVAFYKGSAKEYRMPGMRAGGKLPTGQEMKQTFLINRAGREEIEQSSAPPQLILRRQITFPRPQLSR